MLQTLFYIPTHAFGMPLFGFGILLGAWLVSSVALLAWLVRRQGFNADTQGYVPLLLLFGAFIAWGMPAIASPEGLAIRGYGAMLVMAIALSTWIAARRARQMGVNPEVIFSLAFWMFAAGIAGARAFYIIQYWPQFRRETWGATLAEVVNIAQGGLVVYGALIGGALALVIYLRKYELPGLALCDLVAPSVALGLGLGRLGCFLNGCCYGGPTDLPWAVQFPQGSPPFVRQMEQGALYVHGLKLTDPLADEAVIGDVERGSAAEAAGLRAGQRIVAINGQPIVTIGEAYGALLPIRGGGRPVAIRVAGDVQLHEYVTSPVALRTLPIHPTQLYSTIDGVLLFLFLTSYYPYRRRDGEVLALLLTIHPILRFLSEMIRTDEAEVGWTSDRLAECQRGHLVGGRGIVAVYLAPPHGFGVTGSRIGGELSRTRPPNTQVVRRQVNT